MMPESTIATVTDADDVARATGALHAPGSTPVLIRAPRPPRPAEPCPSGCPPPDRIVLDAQVGPSSHLGHYARDRGGVPLQPNFQEAQSLGPFDLSWGYPRLLPDECPQ